MFAWLGLIITLLVWSGLGLLIGRWHNRELGSISAHGSSTGGAARLFKLILVGSGLAYYWWLVGWYAPHLHLPYLFSVLLSIMVVYQLVTGLVNEPTGRRHDIHIYTAQTMALLYIPLAVLILEAPRVSTVARVIGALLLIYMINSYVIVEVMKRLKATHLIWQLLYIVAFQLLILTSAYLS